MQFNSRLIVTTWYRFEKQTTKFVEFILFSSLIFSAKSWVFFEQKKIKKQQKQLFLQRCDVSMCRHDAILPSENLKIGKIL